MTSRGNAVRLQLTLSPRQVAMLLTAVAVISSVLLAATAISHDLSGTPGEAGLAFKVLTRLNLGNENNLGAWFSSSLLASIAAAAVLCLAAERAGTARGLAGPLGWSLVALLFAGLSLDELGSLHERLPDLQPGLYWLFWLGPFVVAIPVFLGVFGYLRLRHRLLSVSLLAVGIAAFCLVPLQEYLEFLPADGVRRQAWQVVAEEGSELLGMTAFLAALLCYAISDPGEKWQVLVTRDISLTFDANLLRVVVVTTAALLAVVCQAAAVLWPAEGDLFGKLENWPSVALATGLAAFAVIVASQRSSDATEQRAALLIGVFAVAISAFVGADLYATTDNLTAVWALRAAMAVAAVITLGLAALATRGRQRLLALLAVALVVAGCLAPDWLAPQLYLASIVLVALAAIDGAEGSVRPS